MVALDPPPSVDHVEYHHKLAVQAVVRHRQHKANRERIEAQQALELVQLHTWLALDAEARP